VRFIDANIFIRLITRDDPSKASACLQLFQRLRQGREEATTSEAVIAEIVYVLVSTRQPYRLARTDIRARLMPLLRVRGLRLPERGALIRALEVFELYDDLDFEDALTVARMEGVGIEELQSYDRGFDVVSGIRRVEP